MAKQSNSANDICGSIQSSDSIDPFEGLDLNDICVRPEQIQTADTAVQESPPETELFDLNPLDGVNLQDVCVPPDEIPSAPEMDDHEQFMQALKESDLTSTPVIPKNKNLTATAIEEQTDPVDAFLASETVHNTPKPSANSVMPVVEKAYHYAELTQIRQKVFASLKETNGKTLLIASPLDNTGSSLLAAALAYDISCSFQQSVLLIDCNMRRAGLHNFFYVPQSYGFTDLIVNNIPWQAVVKQTSTSSLSIITAGEPVKNFSEYFRYAHIPNLVKEIRNQYDLIIFDTSPVLRPNRNNVNIAALAAVSDYFLLVTKQFGMTRDQLKETKAIVEAGNGKINGIVINEYTPSPKPTPYK